MDALQQHQIDLIILDLRLPGPVGGEQLLFTLRDQGNDVPVIVLRGGRRRCHQAGARLRACRAEETDSS